MTSSIETKKKILFICFYDSSMKLSAPLINSCKQNNYEVTVFFLHSENESLKNQAIFLGINEPIIWGNFITLAQNTYFNADLIHLVVPGHITRKICTDLYRQFKNTPDKRPRIVIGLVGLLAGKEYDCYYSRQYSDLIYVGSERDRAILAKICSEFGDSSNRIINSGLPIYDEPARIKPKIIINHPLSRKIVFAAQPTFPASYRERCYIVDRLLDLAERFPKDQIVLKPRHKLNEMTFHKDIYHFENILRDIEKIRSTPNNFFIDYKPISEHLLDTDLFLTISSTVALEGLCAGIKVGIVADFGITEAYGNHFFIGSGIFITFSELISGKSPSVNPEWLNSAVNTEGHCVEIVTKKISELLTTNPTHISEPFFIKYCDDYLNYVNAKKVASGTEKKSYFRQKVLNRLDRFFFAYLFPTLFKLLNRQPTLRRYTNIFVQKIYDSFSKGQQGS